MARQAKVGIDYFSHDVDMMQDIKLKIIKAKYGLVGYAVYLRLLEEIYRERGYFLEIDEDFKILFSDDCNIEINQFDEILNDCLNKGLFNKTAYESYDVLTSKRIQENYCSATERRKEVEFIEEYLLIDPVEKYKSSVNVNINQVNVDINSKKANTGTQSKEEEKESKGKVEKRTKQSKIAEDIKSLNLLPDLEKAMIDFSIMRKDIKKPLTKVALTRLLKKLNSLSADINYQIAVLDQSIVNGWQGVFELKDGNKVQQSNGFMDTLQEIYAEEERKEYE